jgi:broad specificity phosphatase PhoE
VELVLLRHAQPGWTDENDRGVKDPGLTPLGWQKAAELSACLGTEAFDSILVSSYRRCQETARAVFGESDERLQTEDWLREITLPDFSQQPAEQVIEFFKEAKSRPLSSWWDGMPGGESFRDFHARIRSGLINHLESLGIRRLRPDHKDDMHLFSIDPEAYRGRHLVVSHLGTSGLILSELLHLELVPWIWESFCLDWNGIVRLETARVADGYIFCLRSFNEKGHRDPTLGLPSGEAPSSNS